MDEYSVPRLDRHSKVPRRPLNIDDSSGGESVNLAESQFLFKDDTPPRSQRYGLRRRPKPRQMYSP